MAEGLAKQWLKKNSLELTYKVQSRALTEMYEPAGSPASEHGIEVMRSVYGVDISSHRSALLSLEDVNNAEIIIGVTNYHSRYIEQKYPDAVSKLYSFESDVNDPWHSPFSVYEECAKTMQPLIDKVLRQITSNIRIRK